MVGIEYRGKKIDTSEWVYGFYWNEQDYSAKDKIIRHYIKSFDDGLDYEVESTSLGRYTGKTDINGVKIYEGDSVNFYVRMDYFLKTPRRGYVFWNEDLGGWYIQDFFSYRAKANLYLAQELSVNQTPREFV